mmetsp:Transcript_2003/g.4588  ORF Transcript_2003/g.4588 Transcript_2003/m.4588 type:complete len:82 (+) Transcript_2003:318-563(+)
MQKGARRVRGKRNSNCGERRKKGGRDKVIFGSQYLLNTRCGATVDSKDSKCTTNSLRRNSFMEQTVEKSSKYAKKTDFPAD